VRPNWRSSLEKSKQVENDKSLRPHRPHRTRETATNAQKYSIAHKRPNPNFPLVIHHLLVVFHISIIIIIDNLLVQHPHTHINASLSYYSTIYIHILIMLSGRSAMMIRRTAGTVATKAMHQPTASTTTMSIRAMSSDATYTFDLSNCFEVRGCCCCFVGICSCLLTGHALYVQG
jgi:hypothetical protein